MNFCGPFYLSHPVFHSRHPTQQQRQRERERRDPKSEKRKRRRRWRFLFLTVTACGFAGSNGEDRENDFVERRRAPSVDGDVQAPTARRAAEIAGSTATTKNDERPTETAGRRGSIARRPPLMVSRPHYPMPDPTRHSPTARRRIRGVSPSAVASAATSFFARCNILVRSREGARRRRTTASRSSRTVGSTRSWPRHLRSNGTARSQLHGLGRAVADGRRM